MGGMVGWWQGKGWGWGGTMREKPARLKAVRNLRQASMYSETHVSFRSQYSAEHLCPVLHSPAYWPPHTMLKPPAGQR
jgi:hypothetical protein